MESTRNPLARLAATAILAGTLTVSGLLGLADPADASERTREPVTRHGEPTTLMLVEQRPAKLGFSAGPTADTGDQQFCDGTPVPDDIVECDIDEIAWTCVNGDTNPLDGGCIGNVDKPSVFPQD